MSPSACRQRIIRGLLPLLILTIFIFAASSPSVSAVPKIPKPQGDIYVQDFEQLLTPEQTRYLLSLGRTLEDRTKAQIAVLTVPSLGDESIEEYSLQALRTYQLGDAKLNNGVLLLVSLGDNQPGNRQVRIEVGYGLEGALPDGKTGRILDQVTIPYIENQQPGQGIVETYKVLYNEVAKEYGADQELSPQEVALPDSAASAEGGGLSPLWVIIIVAFIIIDIVFFRGTFTMLLLSILGRGGGFRGGGGGGFRGGGGGSSGGGGASRRF
ncbi:TPM domain-containing protein [Paenibacillus woosongensis]|uniref:TPM domain-containing protein n=1 Tax=Paenibacillus woosongensis TaxID=307580 RepID=A0A7X2Z1L0_9BACL|nr:TPM domain-containing protein [Paenibacillus woosongensis]MUG45917.1 TPM domain-containing protein [Paenibacillus woosongensis]